MYAVVQTSGRQYRVSEGDEIVVDRIDAEVGSTVDLEQVLLIGGDEASIGAPFVDGARVVAEVTAHQRGPKIDIYKFKRRKRYRKTMGFRASQTTLRIQTIER
ncbi:MAG: 50S ribosomal protein L21 [Myxococcota bacterium]